MANILDRYGIKEVADVTFYDLDSTGTPTNPVLFLDTLKVSTIEETAEESSANGGKGNAPLVIWDYGKEINVTLEDALFSAKSMAIMFGNGKVKSYNGDNAYIMKTEQFSAVALTGDSPALPTEAATAAAATTISGWKQGFEGPDGTVYIKHNPKFYDAAGNALTASTWNSGIGASGKNTYFCTFDLLVDGAVIEVGANTFPGTYYVTGDTYARSEASGKDEFFQFVIPKAKVTSENTLTLEAEGDPSVFNMSLKVMRPADGIMMKLVKYNIADTGSTAEEATTATIVHNHALLPVTQG